MSAGRGGGFYGGGGTSARRPGRQGTGASKPGSVVTSQGGSSLPTGLVFASEWSTGTGATDAALRDTARTRPWTATSGATVDAAVRVTSSDGYNYPTTNYLRVPATPTSSGLLEIRFVSADNYLPTINVGDTVGLRFYRAFRLADPWTYDTETHGIYFDATGSEGWGPQALGIYDRGLAASGSEIVVSADSGQDPRYFWVGDQSPVVRVGNNTTRREEYLYTRTGTDSYELKASLYDINGTRLYDSANYVDYFNAGGGPYTLPRTFTKTGAGASTMRGLKIGCNGMSPAPASNIPFYDITGLVVCRNGSWPIGAYAAAEKDWVP